MKKIILALFVLFVFPSLSSAFSFTPGTGQNQKFNKDNILLSEEFTEKGHSILISYDRHYDTGKVKAAFIVDLSEWNNQGTSILGSYENKIRIFDENGNPLSEIKSINDLKPPVEFVHESSYLDGGTSIFIVKDRNNKVFYFGQKAEWNVSTGKPEQTQGQFYFGAEYYDYPDAQMVEVGSKDEKMLDDLLKTNRDSSWSSVDKAILEDMRKERKK